MPGPQLTGFNTNVTFNENTVNAAPQLFVGAATFDYDNPAALQYSYLYVTGLLAEDRVSVRNQGTSAGQIGLSGSNITYSGVTIGTLNGGVGADIEIALNDKITVPALQALFRNLTYSDVSDTPTADRSLTLSLKYVDGVQANSLNAGTPDFTELTGAANPFSTLTIGAGGKPALIDVDNDGDKDLAVGGADGTIRYFRNDGGSFTELTGAANPFKNIDVGDNAALTFKQIEGSADLDLIVGNAAGQFKLFTYSAGFYVASSQTFLASADIGSNATPAIVDIFADGIPDMFAGAADGTIYYFENGSFQRGVPQNPFYVAHPSDPASAADVGSDSSVAFADFDGDGDFDAVVGAADGKVHYFENTFASYFPTFYERTGAANPFEGVSLGSGSYVQVGDFDGDSDADLLVTDASGAIHYYRNNQHLTQINIHVNAQSEGPSLVGVDPTLTVNEGGLAQLIDNDVVFSSFSSNFNGGHLIVGGVLAEDRVAIQNQGTGAGQIGVSGANVTYQGVTIGTFTGGSGVPFVVTFDAAANVTAIDALVQSLTYRDVSDSPSPSHDLSFYITDALGQVANLPFTAVATEFTSSDRSSPLFNQYVGADAAPAVFDFDNDGDLDIVAGNADGHLSAYRNDLGTFTPLTGAANPFDSVSVAAEARPVFIDYDGDGDRDIVVGALDGALRYFKNNAGAYVEQTGGANPFNGIDVGSVSGPSFVDIDGDGDLDLVVAGASGLGSGGDGHPSDNGTLYLFRNTGGVYSAVTGAANPLNNVAFGQNIAVAFGDFDGDGDADLVQSGYADGLRYYENTGTKAAPVFTSSGNANPFIESYTFGGFFGSSYGKPTLVDFDGDGDLDVVVGTANGGLYYFRNDLPLPTITVAVNPVNDAPVVIGSAGAISASEDSSFPASYPVSLLAAATFSDPDAGPGATTADFAGLAITGNTETAGQGHWMYFNNGGWADVGTVSASTALVVDSSTLLRFFPAADFNGPAPVLTAHLIDSSTTAATGDIVDISGGAATGGTTPYSTGTISIGGTVTAVNDAPVVTGTAVSLSDINQGDTPTGQLISALVDPIFSDAKDQVSGGSSANTLVGIVISANAATVAQGIWQFSENGGSTWTAIPPAFETPFLHADSLLRFLPAVGFSGAAPVLTAHLIDSSFASTFSPFDDYELSRTDYGGSSPFSAGTFTIGETIVRVNVAPVLSDTNVMLAAVNEDAGAPSGAVGTLISALVDLLGGGGLDNVTDADPGSVTGIALTATSGSGTWFYSIDNGASWAAVGVVSDASARLLAADSGTRVYYQPATDFAGTITGAITFRAWDTSAGTNGALANTSSNGGSTAFSTAGDTADITVTAVNDAPVVIVASGSLHQSAAEDADHIVTGLSIADVDAATGGLTTTLLVGHGTLTITSAGGTTVTGNGTGTVVLEGTVADINTALAAAGNVVYRGAQDFNGQDTLTVTVNDNGHTGSDPGLTGGPNDEQGSNSIDLVVTAVNDAVTSTAPAALQLNEDSSTPIGGLSIADVDAILAPSATYQVSLSASHGSLTLTDTTGLTVGANGTHAATFTGTLADINAALATAIYAGDANYNGSDTITFAVTDDVSGTVATGSGSATNASAAISVTIDAVRDAIADALMTNEDTPGTLNVLANDMFGAGATLSATTNGAHGTVTIGAGGNVTYTPGADYNGSDTFTYTANTVGGSAETATVTVTINAAQDANNDSLTTNEDTPGPVNVLANDTFSAGAVVTGVTNGVHGTVTIGAGGIVTYTPAADYNGADSFTYRANTADGGPDETATVNVTVTALPDANNDTLTTNEDTAGTLNVLANDTFWSGAVVSGATNGAHGKVTIGAGGNVTYTPDADYNGADTFTYTANTTGGTAETATVDVTINAAQDVNADTLTTNEDTAGTTNVLANDTLGAGAAVSAVTNGAHGTVTIGGGGNVTYTPDANFNGADGFTYTANTTGGTAETGTVNVTVAAVRDANADALATNEDTAGTLNVLANDTFGSGATVTAVTSGAHGTVTIGAGGNVTYTPGVNYNGTDTFTYTANTAGGAAETATVNVTINAAQDANADALTTDEDTAGTVNVLSNDIFGAGAVVTGVTNGAHGTVTIGAGGNVTYTPGANYNGADSFSYSANTANGGPDESATVYVTVNAAQDGNADALTTNEDTAGTINVLTNDSFGPAAVVTGVTDGAHGTVSIGLGGNVIYTPSPDYNGTDTFTYTANTAGGGPDETATVNVTVRAVNDAPIANADTLAAIAEDAGVQTIAFTALTGNDKRGPTPATDESIQALTVTTVSTPIGGSVAIVSGHIEFTPTENFNGLAGFDYTIQDNGTTNGVADPKSATGHASFTITPVDDAPVSSDGSAAGNEDTAISGVVLAADIDNSASQLSYALVGANGGAMHGTVTLNADGSFIYTPELNFNGNDNFNFSASDGTLGSNVATQSIVVNAVEDAPSVAAGAESASGDRNTVILGTLRPGSDPDQDTLTFKLVASSSQHGTVTVGPTTGAYSFTPDHNYHGAAGFSYVVNDGQLDSTAKAVSLAVTGGLEPGSIDLGLHPGGGVVEAVGDFNHDGTSDILFRDPGTGNVDEWQLQDGHWQASIDLGASHGSLDWRIVGAGDFNADGNSDVLWFNQTTGQVDEWQMRDGNWFNSINLGATHGSLDWQIAGIGDFDGDHSSDVLWLNHKTGQVDEWQMKDGNWSSSINPGPAFGSTDWKVAGTGDFDGDGTSDVLWFNRVTGQVEEWQMKDGQQTKTFDFGATHGSLDWQVSSVGDADGDGTSDVLWLNTKTGAMDLWKMADGNWSGSFTAGSQPLTSQVVGAGDVNHDQTDDALFHNSLNGHIIAGLNMNVTDPHFYDLFG